jgi:non-ribosomal peptide synthetase component F
MTNIGDTALEAAIESFEPVHLEEVQDVKFDLEVYVTEYTNGIEMSWVYKKNMFKPATVDYMIRQYINQLEFFGKNPGQSFKDYLDKKKKKKGRSFKKSKGASSHVGMEI